MSHGRADRPLAPPPHISADAEKPDRAARAEWIVAVSAEGHSVTDIARALGVTRQTVYNARHSGGVIGRSGRPRKGRKTSYIPSAKPATTERPCLTCGKRFLSEGPHNRMCRDCRRRGDPFSAR